MVKNTSTELKRDDIRTVHLVGGKSAKKGALIGLGVGAGTGALIGGVIDASGDNFPLAKGVTTAIGTILGAGLGALGGALIGRGKRVLLYEAK